MEVIIEETDDSEHGIVVTGGGVEALSGSVQRHGPAVVAYGQVLGNLVTRSNERLEEHRDWLANLPRLEADDSTESLEPSIVSVPTKTLTGDHGVITSPPSLERRLDFRIPSFPAIPGLSLCGSSVSSAVAAASADALNALNSISLAAQESVAAAEASAQQSAAAAISMASIQISASFALSAQKTSTPPPAPSPATPATAPPVVTSTITSIVSLTTTVSALTTLPATTLEATTVLATITITLSGTEVPSTTITSVVPGNRPSSSSSTAVGGAGGGEGGGGVGTSLGVSASSALASVIASASAAIASASQEANAAKSSASLAMQQAQSSISAIASQATATVQTVRTIADNKLLFALVVTFSIIGSSIISILAFFLITRCLRRRREAKQGIRVIDTRDSQETMFRRATDEPVTQIYDPTGFGDGRRSLSRGRRSLSRGGNGGMPGGIRELPPGLPGNIVGFIVDDSRGQAQRGEMMERDRSTPPTNGDSPTRGRTFDAPPPFRQEQDGSRRTPSRKNTLTYDPDRPNSPPLFGLAGELNEGLSRLSRLDIPTMPSPPGPLNQNTPNKSAGGLRSAGGYSRGDRSAGALSRVETPREVKFTDSAFSAFGTDSSYRGVSSVPTLPNRSTADTMGRLSTLPSLKTISDNRSTINTEPSTLDPRASEMNGEEVPIGLEIERGISPSVYSVGDMREVKDGRIENSVGRIESSKGEIMGGGGVLVGLDVLREATNRRLRERERERNGGSAGNEGRNGAGDNIGTAV